MIELAQLYFIFNWEFVLAEQAWAKSKKERLRDVVRARSAKPLQKVRVAHQRRAQRVSR